MNPQAAGRLAALQNAMDELRQAGEAALRSNVELRRENDSLALKNCELAAAGDACPVASVSALYFLVLLQRRRGRPSAGSCSARS